MLTHRRLSIVNASSRLHTTSMGRMLLAGLNHTVLGSPHRDAPPRLPPLLDRTRRDARRSHMQKLEEFEDGMASLAATLRGEAGVIAAVSTTAPVAKEKGVAARLAAVVSTARAVSAAPGGPPVTPLAA